jgi:hypothetical protein
MAVDAVAAGTGLVDEVELGGALFQRRDSAVEGVEIAADRGEVRDRAVVTALGQCEIDRMLVDIHADERDSLAHDLPPLRVALHAGPIPARNPRCARGRSSFNTQPL